MTNYFETNFNVPGFNYEPLDQYNAELIQDFYSIESREKILKMAIHLYKKRYDDTPKMTKIMLNWAMNNTMDRRHFWKDSIHPHNLRIEAAQRLVEKMVETVYWTNVDWFHVQEQLRDQEVPIVCGSHFRDKQKFQSPNIL